MKHLRLLLFALLLTPLTSKAQELTRILFILDASNSMNANWGEQTRINAAKELLIKAVDSLKGSANLEIALRVYGHQSPITATYQDCNDTKLEVPFAKDNYEAVKNRIRTIMAKGTTPIARSLEAAAADFPDNTSRNIIILITDGLEACDNDPCVIAKKLHDKGVRVTPFVIGLGLDLSYLEQFRCIGSYTEAETKNGFKMALKTVIGKAPVNTTAQINLNNSSGQPLETDVTVFLYEAGTKNLVYTFEHTLNRQGLPDTPVIDPGMKYDMVVNTTPVVEVKNIALTRNTHNTIPANTPQGIIRVRFINATRQYLVQTRISLAGSPRTLNTQLINISDKYIVGKYDIEVLTLPRIHKTVDVLQSDITNIDISAPGQLSYSTPKPVVGQIFVINESGVDEWVCNLDQLTTSGSWQLQPGEYKLVYRQKNLRSTQLYERKEIQDRIE